jgi:hypothetical protein
MRKPNLFVLGAPKCGTTTLAAWLALHPDVFMSPRKEPHFFNSDHGYRGVSSEREYLSLFAGAHDETRVGEASVWYLASHAAVPAIEQCYSGAQYIVCLRNPVEMAFSLFRQQRFNGIEYETEFDRAWQLAEIRASGKPARCWKTEPRYTDYYSACLLGEQFSRLLQTVPEHRVFPVLLEDMATKPDAVLRQVVHFLGIRDDIRPLARENAAKTRRTQTLNRCVRLLGRLRRHCGIRHGFGMLSWIDRVNTGPAPADRPTPEMRDCLTDAFRADIQILASRLGRSLDHWMARERSAVCLRA